jgi:uncharacterized protein
MPVKAKYYIIALSALLIAAYFVVAAAFPKDLNRFPLFVLIILLDFYLWFSIRKRVYALGMPVKYLLGILYWIPFSMVLLLGIASIFINVYIWQPQWATLFGGIIFITYIAKLFTILVFLAADLIRITGHVGRFLYHRKKGTPCPEKGARMSRAGFLTKLGLIGGGFVLSGLIIGAVRWAYDFRIRREYLRYPLLPRQLHGLKIVHISDLHLGSWANGAAMQEAVDAINEEDPDLIFFTGDLVNFVTGEAYRYQDILAQAKARYGVYAVLGNHDYGDYVKWTTKAEKEQNLRDLEELYHDMGWKLLRNSHAMVYPGNVPLAVMGVENWSSYERFPSYGDVLKALKGTENASFRILLSHDPTHWENIISKHHPNIALTLSGHTHGFQFGVELKNFRWSPAQYMYRHWAGLYANPATDTPQYLYVNRGLGMIGYPGRIGIMPEITVIELHP